MSETLYVDARLKPIVEHQLDTFRTRDTEGEPRPVTTVHGHVLHNLQIQADVEGYKFLSDEPISMGGQDGGPAPLRYFLAGVMMCHQVWVVKGAARRGLDLSSVSGKITGFVGGRPPRDDGSRPFTKIEYELNVGTDAPAESIKEVVDEASRYCPATATVALGSDLRLTVRHNDQLI